LDFNYLNLLDVEKYHNQFILIKISWLNFNCVTPTFVKKKFITENIAYPASIE
jgi:hypothetical protein